MLEEHDDMIGNVGIWDRHARHDTTMSCVSWRSEICDGANAGV